MECFFWLTKILTERNNKMADKKKVNFQSPNLNNFQRVEIDHKTVIFIAKGADPVKAKIRYLEQINAKYVKK